MWPGHRGWHQAPFVRQHTVTQFPCFLPDNGFRGKVKKVKIQEWADSRREKSIICLIRVKATQKDVFVESSRSSNDLAKEHFLIYIEFT